MARTLFHIIRQRYKQFGGMKVVRFYAKHGAFWPLVKGIMKSPFYRSSYLNAYHEATRIVGEHLCRQYHTLMLERKDHYSGLALEHEKSNNVWFCWMQGMDNAPEVVKMCYASILRNLSERKVKVIDGKNWMEYVELPDYVVERWEKRQIPPAHFTDLLRIELLIRYGGTWIDSTVLCTGIYPQNEKETMSFLDADLFMFQYTQPGSDQWRGISNWFISACSNNEVLMVLRDMLYAYWKDYDCMVDYYIFHQFFSILREVYPDEIGAMPYGYSMRSLALGHHWGDKYVKEQWEKLVSRVCFHKLSYNVRKQVKNGEGNYYHYMVDSYLHEN